MSKVEGKRYFKGYPLRRWVLHPLITLRRKHEWDKLPKDEKIDFLMICARFHAITLMFCNKLNQPEEKEKFIQAWQKSIDKVESQ